MTVQECYESIGADFEGVLGRMGSEAMVKRFALKFLDEPSYRSLVKAVEEQNAEGAFRAAHTLKGICLNLGLDGLYEVCASLTERLRGREFNGYEEAYGKVQQELVEIQKFPDLCFCILGKTAKNLEKGT